jgi:hypothetical protein
VQVNFFYFPGWQVTVDGLPASIRPSPTGSIMVDVGAGRHVIDARFGDTQPRTLGALLSGVMLVAAIALVAWRPRSTVPSARPGDERGKA